MELVFKDSQTQVTPWAEEDATIKKLFPDQARFRAEEQERFDLLTAHWDVPLNELNWRRSSTGARVHSARVRRVLVRRCKVLVEVLVRTAHQASSL